MASSTVLCNVCSRLEKYVQILCEGRCFICLRCERSPPIQRLLCDIVSKPSAKGQDFTILDKQDTLESPSVQPQHDAEAKELYKCPLCEHCLARSMLTVIRAMQSKMAAYKSKSTPSNFLADSSSMFEASDNALLSFLRKFRQLYPDIAESIPSSAGQQGFQQPGNGSNSKGANNYEVIDTNDATAKIKAPKKNSNNPYEKSFPVMTTAQAHDVVIDIYCSMLASLHRSVMCDSAVECLMRISDRKKYSQRTNDFKLKSTIDFFRSDNIYDSPELYLMSKLFGCLPKQKDSRPLWSSLATVMTALATHDKCLRMGKICDEYNNPTVAEIKVLLNKHKPTRILSIKKALRIISALTISHQPHWICAPLYAACVEAGSPMFWTSQSMSRLINLLVNYARTTSHEPTPIALPSQGSNGHPARRELSSPTSMAAESIGAATTTSANTTNTSITKGAAASVTSSAVGVATVATALPPSVLDMNRPNKMKNLSLLAKEFWKAKVVDDHRTLSRSSRSSRKLDQSQRGRADSGESFFGRQKSPAHMDELTASNTSLNARPHVATKMSMSNERRETLNSSSSSHTKHFGRTLSPSPTVNPNGRLSPIEVPSMQVGHGGSHAYNSPSHRQQPIGCIVDGSIRDVDIEQSISEVGDIGLTVSAAELILICIDAWEEEFQYVRYCVERAQVSKHRRQAVCGTFNVNFEVNAEYRLAVERIIDWYAKNGFKGVDWEDVKARATNRDFPFHVPNVLLSKSCAELNYVMENIQNERTNRRAKETLEDLLTLSGPYGHITKLGGIESMKLDSTQVLTRQEKEALLREKYLSEQTLGHYNLVDLTGSNPRVQLDPFSHHSFVPPAADDRVSNARIHAKGYEFSEDIGIRGGRWGADNRLKAPTIRKLKVESALVELAEESAVNLPQSTQPNYSLLKTVEVFPEVITRSEIEYDADRVEELREPIAPPSAFAMPTLPGLQDGQFFSISPDDANSCALTMIDAMRLQLNVTEDAKSRIRRRLNKAIEAMNSNGAGGNNNSTSSGSGGKNSALTELLKTDEFKTESLVSGAEHDALEGGDGVPKPQPKPEQPFESMLDLNKVFGNNLIDPEPMSQLSVKKAEDSRVDAIALRGLSLSEQALMDLAERFLKPWQVELLLKADFTDTHLDDTAVRILAPRFSVTCGNLMHLNVSCCRLGEVGTKELLQCLYQGGAAHSLLRIDLKQNNITMATDALLSLSKFPRLRALDLSLNYLTLDVRRQQDFFFSVMLPLKDLRSLSVAFNRIQDIGFTILYEIMHAYLPNLRVMDIANCFITNKSIEVVQAMVDLTWPKLDILMLQGNLLLSSAVEALRASAEAKGLKIYLQDDPYVGIEEPLMYDIETDAQKPSAEQLARIAANKSIASSSGSRQAEDNSSHASHSRRQAKGYVPDQQYRNKKKSNSNKP